MGDGLMATEAQSKASDKYNKENTLCVLLRLNFSTDRDVIQKLESVPSKMGYIKKLIRKDMKENGFTAESRKSG